jgi:hypothetical protein
MPNFPPNSRYYGIGSKKLERADGAEVVYLQQRLVPAPERFATLEVHVVEQGERPDHIAHLHFADAEQFWRLCDANAALHPQELTETPGRQLRVTLPEGIPGPSDA